MSSGEKRWLLRDNEGGIRGPLSTYDVLQLISKGLLTGEEEIALFPGTHWRSVAQTPEFYDHLLEVLSQFGSKEDSGSSEVDLSAIEGEQSETTQSPDVEIVSSQSSQGDTFSDSSQGPTIGDEDALELESPTHSRSYSEVDGDSFTQSSYGRRRSGTRSGSRRSRSKGSRSSRRSKKGQGSRSRDDYRDSRSYEDSDEVIELHQMGEVRKQAFFSRLKWPVTIVVFGVLAAYVFLDQEQSRGGFFKLSKPQGRSSQSLSSDQVKELYQKSVRAYYLDTFENYLRAQSNLIKVVEGAPKFFPAQSQLCLTYLQLWPHTRQTSTDFDAINTLQRYVSKSSPEQPHSSICRFVELMAKGQFQPANQLVDRSLDEFAGGRSSSLTFYFFKSLLLKLNKDYPTALGCATSAIRSNPGWLRLHILEGELFLLNREPAKAAVKFRQVLKANPKHREARLHLGLLEYDSFRHYEKARALLTPAVDPAVGVRRGLLAKAFLSLARIHVYRNEKSRALHYAQRAYGLNPTDSISKNLVIKLGGVEQLKKTVVREQQLIVEGDQFVREGDFNAAQAHYKSAYKLNKKNALAAMKAAKSLWSMSLSQEAIEWMNKAIRADPRLTEAYVVLAEYHTHRFDFLAAARVLGRAKSVSPRSPEVYRGFAMIELHRGNPKGTLGFAKQAISLYDQDLQSHLLLSEAHLALQQYREAYAHALKAIGLDSTSARAHKAYANAIVGMQGVELGIAYMQDLVSRYPQVMEYREGLGEILLNDERYAEAEAVYREIIRLSEKPKLALIQLGEALTLQRRFEEALDAYLQAAVIDPSDSEPVFQLGMLYMNVGKADMARKQFERVLKINDRYPLVHYHIGLAALEAGKPKVALEQAQLERQKNPNLADSYLLGAEAYARLKQFTLCAREYQKAIKLRPQGADIYVKVAHCYRRSGNLDVASAMLTQAVNIESGLPDIYREQGLIFETQGAREQAIKAYERYLVLQPNAPDRTLISKKISQLSGVGRAGSF